MYDMYSWDQAKHSAFSAGKTPYGQGEEHAEAAQTVKPARAVQAVQVALDRRDNGGESGH